MYEHYIHYDRSAASFLLFVSLGLWSFPMNKKKKWCSRQFAFIIAFGKMKMLYCVHCRWCRAAFFRLFMCFRSRIPGQRKNDIVQQLGFNERYAWFYVHVPHTDSIAPLQTRTMLGVWCFFSLLVFNAIYGHTENRKSTNLLLAASTSCFLLVRHRYIAAVQTFPHRLMFHVNRVTCVRAPGKSHWMCPVSYLYYRVDGMPCERPTIPNAD